MNPATATADEIAPSLAEDAPVADPRSFPDEPAPVPGGSASPETRPAAAVIASAAPTPPVALLPLPSARDSFLMALLGPAAFGAAAALGHGAKAMARGAGLAPALFLGGAALAAPTLYLATSLGGGRVSADHVGRATLSSLGTVGTLLLGLAVPAAYFSVTLHTALAPALLVAILALAGTTGVLTTLVRTLDEERSDSVRFFCTGWVVIALLMGGRLLSTLGKTAGLWGLAMAQTWDSNAVLAVPSKRAAGDSPREAAPPRAERPAPSPALVLVEELLRDPTRFIDRLDEAESPALVRSLLGIIAVTGAIFGAAVGMFRGGIQTLYCATKVPLVLLVTLAVSAPAFLAVARATRTEISARGLIGLTLGASARFGLVLAGLAPVVWLCEGVAGYHRMILVTVLACAIAGCMAGGLLFRGLARAKGHGALAGLCIVGIFAIVGGHSSWMLRPFVVRPRTEHVPFLRPVESDLASSVGKSTRSAAGLYDVDNAWRATESD